MFSAAEMQLIRANCLPKFEALLKRLSIPIPDWNAGNEFRIRNDNNYNEVDEELTKEICALMKSDTIIDGYTNLLKAGGISYDYSESYNQLLDMIVTNRDKILDAIRNQNAARASWEEKYSSMSRTETIEQLKIEVANVKPFNKFKLINRFDSIKKDYSPYLLNAREAVDCCIGEVNNLSNLLEISGASFYFESVEDFIKAISEELRAGNTCNVNLKIKKVVERREKKIPLKPEASIFTLQEAQEALDVLAQVQEIILLEG